jgi:hypothetical protein
MLISRQDNCRLTHSYPANRHDCIWHKFGPQVNNRVHANFDSGMKVGAMKH